MKTTVTAIRRIIREELRRAVLDEAINTLRESIDKELLREWDYTPAAKQRELRRTGIGPYAETPKTNAEDPGKLMQSALQMLTVAKNNPKTDIGKVVSQLEALYVSLKGSNNTVHSTTWAAAVKKALDTVSQLKNNPGHETRSSRLQFAQNKIETLGKNLHA